MAKSVGIGIIGAGVISTIYLKNLTALWNHVHVVGIADLFPERAAERAAEFGVQALTIDELLAHPEIEIVVNLTIPAAHAAVSLQVIAAGKHVHTEKPLATSLADGKAVLEAAARAGVLVGNAPDTFLGAGLQTVRRAIDDGLIGTPIAFNARMVTHGMEDWHPDPYFFYQPGGGPMLDMGPYYVTSLVSILGPVRSLSSRTSIGFAQRVITTENSAKKGDAIPVNTPTHIETVLELESGVTGTLTTSFDLWDETHSWYVIYGTEGTIRLPDPNYFGGPVKLYDAQRQWRELDLVSDITEDSRGIGVADMARALRMGGDHRASGALGFHVLEVLLGAISSGESKQTVEIESTVERPAVL